MFAMQMGQKAQMATYILNVSGHQQARTICRRFARAYYTQTDLKLSSARKIRQLCKGNIFIFISSLKGKQSVTVEEYDPPPLGPVWLKKICLLIIFGRYMSSLFVSFLERKLWHIIVGLSCCFG